MSIRKVFFYILVLIVLSCGHISNAYAQPNPRFEGYTPTDRFAFSMGLNKGGATNLGLEFEYMPGNVFGWFLGTGYMGVNAGFNIHFDRDVRSNAIGFAIQREGPILEHHRTYASMHFLLRTDRRIESSIGFGFVLEEGPNLPRNLRNETFIFQYTIGLYFSGAAR